MIEIIKKELKKAVGAEVDFDISASEKEDFGHYSTNVAFKLAPALKKAPMEIAADLVGKLKATQPSHKASAGKAGSIFEKIEAVPPGFVNFWIKPEVLQKELGTILKKKLKYGSLVVGRKLSVNLEFVSANPTGPLTMANGRGGFYGDVLARVLESAGNKVTREYYINDTGNQIKLLGESILAAEGKIPEKEEYYKGGYIKILAKNRVILRQAQDKSNAENIGKKAAALLLKEIQKSLKAAGIEHDVWFSEDKNLYRKGELQKVLAFLKKKGLVEEKDGAIWLALSGVEGLNDAVLIKSDGNPTYFLADLAYHHDKFLKRKFDLAIDIWGADHHGYAERMKKGVEALGVKPERLKILITQLVRLVSGGKEVRMSKRKGEFVTMDDLLKEVGTDAVRFFFLMHSLDTHMDFDLDLAKERSQKNPVYYAQYALVRCVNILLKSKIKNKKSKTQIKNLKLLNSESEMKLMLELAKLPDVFAQTASDYQVHRLTKYALELARAFHNFYEKERVLNAEVDLKMARLALVSSTKLVLENIFNILGISKPNKM